jgi:hypothetical protein
MLLHPPNEALSVADHGRLGLARKSDNVMAPRVRLGRLHLGRIFKQKTGVATSCAEVVDKHTPWLSVLPPEWGCVEGNVDIALRQIFGERLVDDGASLDADMRRNGILLQHHQDLA